MPKRDLFIRKLLDKLEKVDRHSVQEHIKEIVGRSELYEEILDHANEGILLLTKQGEIKYLNRQSSLWLQLNVDHTKAPSLYEQLEDRNLSQWFRDQLGSLKQKMVADVTILIPQEMPLRIFLIPMKQGTKEPLVLALLLDCRGPQDQSTWDERIANIESLVKLAAGIAHEIGNPLNSISIHLQLLKGEIKKIDKAKRSKIEKTIEVIQNETDRLDKIVRNFLKATRKPPLRYRQEDLNETIAEALAFLKPELEENKVTVKFSRDGDLPQFLFDRERLYSAFINVIKNAMEAMPKGGPLNIRVSHKNKVVSILFKDGGKGIAEADLPHIFDTYYTTKKEGSGLGLMTVFNSVRDHGGRIEVDSKLKKGTAFTLLLPIRKPKLQLPEIHQA